LHSVLYAVAAVLLLLPQEGALLAANAVGPVGDALAMPEAAPRRMLKVGRVASNRL
jgi:hypothetical protein